MKKLLPGPKPKNPKLPLTVVILAAGYATRLYPLTLHKPKCLIRVGERTILDHLCAKSEPLRAKRTILVTNAKFFGLLARWKKKNARNKDFFILNDGTRSNDERLGAIGDLGLAIRRFRIRTDLLLLASDNLFDGALEDFVAFAKGKPSAISVGLYDIGNPRLAARKYGVLQINKNGLVTDIEEKPEAPKSTLVGMGVYYFPKKTLRFVGRYLEKKNAKDAPGHYVEWLKRRTLIYGFQFKGMWYDVGDLTALKVARRIFRRALPKKKSIL